MIVWPNIGLYGDFAPCEAGVLDAINKNFFILDTLVQMSIIDFVTELPDDPAPGDRYILEDGSYAYTGGPNSIMVFDGEDWIEIEPRPGFIAYVDSADGFFWYNGTDWVILPTSIGDVSGPASSLDNAIARFDGTTGKFITGSGAILDDDDVISSVYAIYTDTAVIDVAKIKTIDFQVTTDSISTGSNQALAYPTTAVTRFTNTLNSIDSISAPPSFTYGRVHIYVNNTVAKITFKNTSSIVTGTGKDLLVDIGASIWIMFLPNISKWCIIGGSGSGGGGFEPGAGSTIGSPLNVGLTGITQANSNFDPTITNQVLFLKTASGEINVTSNPQIQAGTTVGQMLLIHGGSSTDYFILEEGNGLNLAYGSAWYSFLGNSIQFMWNGSVWYELFRRG